MATNQQDLLERIRRQQTLERIRQAQQQQAGGEEPSVSRRPAPERPAAVTPHVEDPHSPPSTEPPEPADRPGFLSRVGRGARAVGRTLRRALPGGEPFIQREEEEELEGGEPRAEPVSKPEDFLSRSDRAILSTEDALRQIGRGFSEVGARQELGIANILDALGAGNIPEGTVGPTGRPIEPEVPGRRAANIRARRELARETFGEPETAAGTTANIATQLLGEGALFAAPGGVASQVARRTGAATRGGRFARLLAEPKGVAQRAVQTFLTGAPIDVVISQAGAEDSMAGALAELTGDTELEDVSRDPVARAAFEVLSGFGLGTVLGETLTAAQRARARPRAERLGRQAAQAGAEQAEAFERAIAELPDELQAVARSSMEQERGRLSAEPERPSVRRRLAEVADPSVRRELEEAYTDPISGLRNQAAFQRAKPRLDADPSTELVIVDLDNFKAVNDNLGLEAGDQVLSEVGQILQQTGIDRRNLFRAGGDEFIIAAPKGQGERLGQLIEDAVGQREIEGTPFTLSARYGVGDTFRAADEAASEAKKASDILRARDVVVREEAGAEAALTPEAPTRQEAPGGVSRETPAGRAPEVLEAQEAAEAAARAPSEEAARPRPAAPARTIAADARLSLQEQAAKAIARPVARTAIGAATGAAVGTVSEEVTPGQGALIGAAAAAGLPGLARAIERGAPGQGGFALFPRRGERLSGRFFSQATEALQAPNAPKKQTAEAWLGYLRGQGVSDDELESIARGLRERPEPVRRVQAALDAIPRDVLDARLADLRMDVQNVLRRVETTGAPPEVVAEDLIQMGQLSRDRAEAVLERLPKELGPQTYTRDELQRVIDTHGLQARITETLRIGEGSEDDLASLQQELSDAQDRMAEYQAEIESYEPGGNTYDDSFLELQDSASRFTNELSDLLEDEGLDALDSRRYDEVRDEIINLLEQEALDEENVDSALEGLYDSIRNILGLEEFDPQFDSAVDLADSYRRLADMSAEASRYRAAFDEAQSDVWSLERQIEEFEDSSGALHEDYTQPGGEDYHEILIQVDAGQHGFQVSGHFPEEDIFVFLRNKLRETRDGSPVYHIEEMQSDLHQQGRKFGYKGGILPAGWQVRELDLEGDAEALAEQIFGGDPAAAAAIRRGEQPPPPHSPLNYESARYVVVDGSGRIRATASTAEGAQQNVLGRSRDLAPNVPFKSTPQWTLVAIKRALWQAIEEGADFLTWASGAQAADNYNPARYGITRIQYDPKQQVLTAWKGDEIVVNRERVSQEGSRSLTDYLGADIERALLETELSSPDAVVRFEGGSDNLDALQLGKTRKVFGQIPNGRVEVEVKNPIPWRRSARVVTTNEHFADFTGPDFVRYRAIRASRPDGQIDLEIRRADPELVAKGEIGQAFEKGDLLVVHPGAPNQDRVNTVLATWLQHRGFDIRPPSYRFNVFEHNRMERYWDTPTLHQGMDTLRRNLNLEESVHELRLERGVQVGGHSQKAYYDSIVPNTVRKYLRSLKTDAEIVPVALDEMKAVVNDRFQEAGARPPLDREQQRAIAAMQQAAQEPFNAGVAREVDERLRFMTSQLERAIKEGSSGEEAIRRVQDFQGLLFAGELEEGWNELLRRFGDPVRQIEAFEPPPTNLGIRITPQLREKIITEGQRLGFMHPALLRPLAGAAVGAAGGAGLSDELGMDPRTAAFFGATFGAAIGARGLRGTGRTRPSAISKRSAEVFNPMVRPSEQLPLAPAAQGGERLPSAGAFANNPAAASPDLVSPTEIVEGLSRALDEAFEQAGLGVGLKTAAGQVRGKGPLKRALGIFKTRQQVIRQVDISDVPVFGHEAGHAMQKLLFGTTKKGALSRDVLNRLGAGVRAELLAMAQGISDESVVEGWAEFWRRYLDNPDVLAREAPQTLAIVEQRLEGFPELQQAWQLARADWQRYRESDALSRVWSKISVGDREPRALSLADRWSRTRTAILDDMEPVRRIVDKIGKAVGLDSFSEEADSLARLVRGAVGTGLHFLEHGVLNFRTGKKVSPGLRQVLEPVLEQLDDFRIYMVARRAQELHARNKLTGFRAEDIDAAVRQLDAQHGERFVTAFAGLQRWNEGMLRYMRDAGVISHDSYNAILELNQSYVPFYRVIEGESAGGLAQTYGHLFSPIKRLKGSGRDVIDPIESLAKNAMLYTQVAQKQQVSRALASLADKEGVGPILEQLGTPIKRTEFRLGEIETQLEEVLPGAKDLLAEARLRAKERFDALTEGLSPEEIARAGIELEDPAEELLAFYRPADFLGRRNTISVLKDGKRVYYEVDPELWQSLEGLNREQLDGWARWLGIPARTLRAGATLAPEFVIRNPARDQVMAFVQSEYGYVPGVDLARGVFELLRKGDAYQEWLAHGGYRAALTSLDRKSMQNAVRQLVDGGGVTNVLKHPFDALQALSALLEDGTRMGEYLNARRQLAAFGEGRGLRGRLGLAGKDVPTQGLSKEQMQRGALAAREISVDFARHGAKTAALRHLSAFWNARLQGYDRLFRAAKNDPVGFSAKAFGIITVPSLLEYYANMDDPDYWEQPQWKRDLFWLIKIGDDFVAIPKPFELGLVFGTLPVRIIDSALGGPGGAHELRGFVEELAKGEVTGTIPFPTAVQPLLENATNYSFFLRRPIVPRAEQDIHGFLQAGPYTSEAARMLARWTYDAPLVGDLGGGRSAFGSPRAIDNLLFAWTGGLGRLATEATDPLLEGRVPLLQPPSVPEIGRRFTEVPGLRGVTDPQAGFSSESVERFYEELNRARTAVSSLRWLERTENQEAYEAELANEEMAELRAREPALADAADELAALRAQVDQIRRDPSMSSEQKRQAVDELGLEARRVAQSALGRQLPGGG